ALGDGKGRVRLYETGGDAAPANLEGRSKRVVCVAFSPDGRLLASADEGGALRLWDVAQKKDLGRFDKKTAPGVTVIALGPSGRVLATGAADGLVTLWDAAAGKELRTLS